MAPLARQSRRRSGREAFGDRRRSSGARRAERRRRAHSLRGGGARMRATGCAAALAAAATRARAPSSAPAPPSAAAPVAARCGFCAASGCGGPCAAPRSPRRAGSAARAGRGRCCAASTRRGGRVAELHRQIFGVAHRPAVCARQRRDSCEERGVKRSGVPSIQLNPGVLRSSPSQHTLLHPSRNRAVEEHELRDPRLARDAEEVVAEGGAGRSASRKPRMRELSSSRAVANCLPRTRRAPPRCRRARLRRP